MGLKLSKRKNNEKSLPIDENLKNSKLSISSDSLDLLSVEPSKIPNVFYKNRKIKARIISVYDAYTVKVIIFIGNEPIKINIRLNRIDAPEVKNGKNGKNRLPIEKVAGKACRDFLKPILEEKIVDLTILKYDKYGGRIIGEIETKIKNKLTNISDMLLEKNYVKLYDGKEKNIWSYGELKNIISNIEYEKLYKNN